MDKMCSYHVHCISLIQRIKNGKVSLMPTDDVTKVDINGPSVGAPGARTSLVDQVINQTTTVIIG